jgi:histone deacetylase complex regulatory component SIN3
MKEKIDKIIDDLINQRALTIPVVMLRLEEKLQEYKVTIENLKEHNTLIKRKEILKLICT